MKAENLKIGGVVLCGGQSRRMGRPKHLLPFGNQCLLQRSVDTLRGVVGTVGVVAAPEQSLPTLDAAVAVFRDETPGLGPLSGIAAGLTGFQQELDAVYFTACDVPFLQPAFVRSVIARLGDRDMAIVSGERYVHPLAAVYRTRLTDRVRTLIKRDRLRPVFLMDDCDAEVVAEDDLRAVDPDLRSLKNVNTPDEYRAALKLAGLKHDE